MAVRIWDFSILCKYLIIYSKLKAFHEKSSSNLVTYKHLIYQLHESNYLTNARKFKMTFRTSNHLHTGIKRKFSSLSLSKLTKHGIDFVQGIGYWTACRSRFEFGVTHVTGKMLFVISRMFKTSITMLTLILILVDLRLVTRINPVSHGRLQNVGQVRIGASLSNQSGWDASRFAFMF